jgi:hypothetical protein
VLSLVPWLAQGSHAGDLTQMIGLVAGNVPTRVRYVFPVGAIWPDERIHGAVHEVDMSVEIDLGESRTLGFDWTIRGDNEGLGLTCSETAATREGLLSLDVSDLPEWQQLIGSPVEEVRVAWHVPNARCPSTLWSFGVVTKTSSAVIALGEVRDGSIRYQPDGLVVIFGESTATSYRPAGSDMSSWGTPMIGNRGPIGS